jgi:hypothetical protein
LLLQILLILLVPLGLVGQLLCLLHQLRLLRLLRLVGLVGLLGLLSDLLMTKMSRPICKGLHLHLQFLHHLRYCQRTAEELQLLLMF